MDFGQDLAIVGEEDMATDDIRPPPSMARRCEYTTLDPHYQLPLDLEMLELSHTTVFIDPLDGTREFVEGRLDAVQCLIGIAYK